MVDMKGKNSMLQLESEAKDRKINALQSELEASKVKISDLEDRLSKAIQQHDVTSDRLRETQAELERKFVDLAQKDAQIRSLDAQLYDATVISKDKSVELLNVW